MSEPRRASHDDEERRTVRGDGVDLAVFERGDRSAPTVVLVHGYPDDHRVWAGVAAALAARYHVVSYDVRGAGASGAPSGREGYRLSHLAADLMAVIAATAGSRRAHVVGHDWGSIQAWEAVTEPALARRIASFTSISGPCLDHMGHWLRRGVGRGAWGDVAAQAARSSYIGAFQLPGLAEGVWGAGLARRWPLLLRRLEGIADAPAPPLADAERGLELYRANVRARLRAPRERRTELPVQLIVPRGDPFLAARVAEDVVRWAPDAFVRPVTGGHWIVRRHPERVARWVGALVEHAEPGTPQAGPPGARLRRPRRPQDRPDEGRVVVVTGGASGIGRATALAYAARGATLVLVDRDRPGAEETARRARAEGVGVTVAEVDVSDAEAMARLAAEVEREHGAPDVVVNNAGIGAAGRFFDTPLASWERILAVNLWGVLHGSRLFGAQMVARGEGGHIVNVASMAAFAPSVVLPAYSTSKAAVLMLTECLRAELAAEGIGVSAICPGIIDTPITRSSPFLGVSAEEQARRQEAAARLYRRRALGPEVVARAIVRAVERDEAVVPVSIEAHVLDVIGRLAPGLARQLARVDLTPR